ncbi:PIP5K4, partial [Symbiodinium sp. CCMP2456]
MEQASALPAEDEVQPIGTDPGQAASAAPPTPDDDYEALLVARFAAENDSSSESDQPTEAKPSEPIAFSLFRNGPWGCIHACIEASDKAACGAARSAAAFSPTDPDPTFFCRRKVAIRYVQLTSLRSGQVPQGLETVEDLAYAYPDLASLDSLLSSLSDDDMHEMGAADALHGVQEIMEAKSSKPM